MFKKKKFCSNKEKWPIFGHFNFLFLFSHTIPIFPFSLCYSSSICIVALSSKNDKDTLTYCIVMIQVKYDIFRIKLLSTNNRYKTKGCEFMKVMPVFTLVQVKN